MNNFKEKLKELRIENEFSQLSLANALGVKQATISQWETGTREPDLDMLVTIAKFFKVSTDYLLGLED